MSSTNKTPNYALNQYIGTDIQRRTDYNSDMLNIDTALKGLEDGKAVKGIAYSNLENNVKIVQGVPAGGKMYLGAGTQTGAIKIKLPKNKTNTMFKFKVKMNGYSTGGKQSNAEYIVKGHNYINGFGYNEDVIATQQVTVVKDNNSTMSPTFYFCTGATEDYILIGEITDTHNHKSVVINNVETHYQGIIDDWASGWEISLVTAIEPLTSQYKVAVTPSLNATRLNGVQEDTEATANTLVKRDSSGFITPSRTEYNIYNFTAIYGKNYVAPASGGQKITLPTAIENKVIEIYKSNTTYNAFLEITGTDLIYDISANNITNQLTAVNGFTKFKYAKFVAMKSMLNAGSDGVVKWVLVDFKTENFIEDIVNNAFNFLKKMTIKSNNTVTLDVQDNSSVSVFTVDTINQVVTGSAVSTTKTANTLVKRDSNGDIVGTINVNGSFVNVLNSHNLNTLFSTGLYYCTTPSNSPTAKNGYCNVYAYTTGYVLQEYYNFDNSEMYTRVYNNNTWSSWKRVFQDEGTNLVANGYTKLSNGLIMQWGTIGATAQYTGASVTFPIAFPTSCLNISLSCYESGADRYNGYSGQVYPAAVTNSGFLAVNGVSQNNIEMQYIAIGK